MCRAASVGKFDERQDTEAYAEHNCETPEELDSHVDLFRRDWPRRMEMNDRHYQSSLVC
jgi:hypothetical protein